MVMMFLSTLDPAPFAQLGADIDDLVEALREIHDGDAGDEEECESDVEDEDVNADRHAEFIKKMCEDAEFELYTLTALLGSTERELRGDGDFTVAESGLDEAHLEALESRIAQAEVLLERGACIIQTVKSKVERVRRLSEKTSAPADVLTLCARLEHILDTLDTAHIIPYGELQADGLTLDAAIESMLQSVPDELPADADMEEDLQRAVESRQTDLCIPRNRFSHLVESIAFTMVAGYDFSPEAMEALQTAAEAYAIDMQGGVPPPRPPLLE